MPEGQSRAEGEQAGSRAEQGPERRGNISVSQSQIPHSPYRQGLLHGTASPSGSPRAQSQGIRKGWHPAGSVEAMGRMAGVGRKGTLSDWLLSVACGAPCSKGAQRRTWGARGDQASSALGPPPPLPTPCPFYPVFHLCQCAICLTHIPCSCSLSLCYILFQKESKAHSSTLEKGLRTLLCPSPSFQLPCVGQHS